MVVVRAWAQSALVCRALVALLTAACVVTECNNTPAQLQS